MQLQVLFKQLGCWTNEEFIRLTHAAAINDTFWIKLEVERISWSQVSLYQNHFTELISKFAFGIGDLDYNISSIRSPELTCDGSFRKCFKKENQIGENGSDIFLYKRGGELGNSFEPYCEVLASEIAKIISPNNSISYSLVNLHGKIASKCNLFTNEKYGYASYAKIRDKTGQDLQETFDYFKNIGCEQQFRELLVTDSLCFNQDRHAGNYGVLFDNDTLEIVTMAPIFDMNISLLPYASMQDFEHIGDKLFEYSPRLGDDFTSIGQIGMNDILRNRVKDMCDFSFSFRGDDIFPPERVECLEKIVRQQALAIIRTDELYTKDVFFSQKAVEMEEIEEKRIIAHNLVNDFMEILENMNLGEEVFISECDSIQILVEKEQYMIVLDFLKNIITIIKNTNEISADTLKKEDPEFKKIYTATENKFRNYMSSVNNQTSLFS